MHELLQIVFEAHFLAVRLAQLEDVANLQELIALCNGGIARKIAVAQILDKIVFLMAIPTCNPVPSMGHLCV